MITVVACSSHVLIDLPLFGGPVFALIAGVFWTTRQERRRVAGESEPVVNHAWSGSPAARAKIDLTPPEWTPSHPATDSVGVRL